MLNNNKYLFRPDWSSSSYCKQFVIKFEEELNHLDSRRTAKLLNAPCCCICNFFSLSPSFVNTLVLEADSILTFYSSLRLRFDVLVLVCHHSSAYVFLLSKLMLSFFYFLNQFRLKEIILIYLIKLFCISYFHLHLVQRWRARVGCCSCLSLLFV